MCYSKEVSFAAGVVMTTGIAYTWWMFVRDQLQAPVYRNILIGYFCIALHQFADALSIATENEWIYKFGLIASVSCMFFYMRSLEKLSQLSLGSRVFSLLIAICAIQILASDFLFENLGFWVRGDRSFAYLFWSGLWLALFIYWNVCLLFYRHVQTSSINRQLLIEYGLYSINLSFILYSLYAYFSVFMKHTYPTSIFSSFDMVKDSPSIWCIFSVIQAFFIPFLFKKMDEKYEWQSPSQPPELNRKKIFIVSAFIWIILFVAFPVFFAAALKHMI